MTNQEDETLEPKNLNPPVLLVALQHLYRQICMMEILDERLPDSYEERYEVMRKAALHQYSYIMEVSRERKVLYYFDTNEVRETARDILNVLLKEEEE